METLPQLKPFIDSLIDFYQEIFFHDNDSELPVVSCNNVRTEFFKLFYENEEFELHSKSDAFEAFDQILGCLHAWAACAQLPPSHN